VEMIVPFRHVSIRVDFDECSTLSTGCDDIRRDRSAAISRDRLHLKAAKHRAQRGKQAQLAQALMRPSTTVDSTTPSEGGAIWDQRAARTGSGTGVGGTLHPEPTKAGTAPSLLLLFGSSSRTRTWDPAVNSRLLYRLS
jgi:hypothetical protein